MTFKNIVFALAISLILLVPAFVAAEVPKELNAYLALPDNSFRWETIEKSDTSTDQTILMELTSQTWHDITWKHYVLVVIPNKITCPNHALLFISGSAIGKKPSDRDKVLIRPLAEASGMCVALLLQVPNQPLLGNFTEDALIGETLLKTLETKDTTWPLLFPMAKSAVKAMDAVQEMLQKEKQFDIKSFIVTGASKRGWTTWLTAASGDKRVVAIAPMVINNLNTREQMKYQIETWGEFSLQIGDYTSRNLVRKDDSSGSAIEGEIGTMIDPYSYLPRLTMPKLLVHGTNDPYWTVDAAKFYFDDLPGVKYMLTLPNAGHGLEGQQIKGMQTIAAFAKAAAQGEEFPTVRWKLTEQAADYKVDTEAGIAVSGAKLWTAQSDTKDFRQTKWTSRNLEPKGVLSVSVPKAEKGHIAFYVEFESNYGGIPYSLTTEVWRF